MKIRVALVDDQDLVRTGFRLVLEADGDFTVVGEASGGRAGVALAARTRPDVVLMDVRMPDLDGIAATRMIVRDSPVRVIVLTTFDSDSSVTQALHAGASAFLLKDVRPAELMQAIRDVHAGDFVLPPALARDVGELADPDAARTLPPSGAPELSVLSPRELEVLIAIGQGLSNPEIAVELFLSESTVKSHVGRILAKLELRDRIQAVILAHRAGLVGGAA
ncbi:response regulator [Pseudoclavibacter sp. 8L]|uniref:response regulator n=1 Tax=Pseudoclavibacter sp. 8L TaxID=2653162 RepID=UPI0012F2BF0F|nr:response regulator transcription factor [Pseudoclavibacter sp. 8L]VXC24491.1 Uncharacterized transcriptional regulatory protein YxjL [Pseudoclavibacter sp. 8L]